MVLGGLLITGLTAWFLATSITGASAQIAGAARKIAQEDLPRLASVAKGMATGDLTRRATIETERVNVWSTDELGTMTAEVSTVIEGLTTVGTVFEVKHAVLARPVG